ncbi:MAG: PhoH family protein, partial [Alphaproteobacteria bacterium]|nr:PhoH family protein [Alphaproteobacteria bacterium]
MPKTHLNGDTNGHFIDAAQNVGARQPASNQNSRAGSFTDIFEAHRLENISDANRFQLVSGLLEDIAEVKRAESSQEAFIIKAKDESGFKLAKKLIASFFEAYREVKQNKDIKKKHYPDELSRRIKKLRQAEGLNSRYEIEIPGFLRGIIPQQRLPLSPGQAPYIDALSDTGVNVVVTLGNFGSGKTFLTVAQALEDIIAGRKSKLVATRKESGVHKKIGAVPGSQHDKTKRDNHAIFEKIVEVFKIWGLSEKEAIEKTELLIKPSKGLLPGQEIVEIVLPDQLEGRTIHNATIILDEAHGVTTAMMRGILGRHGDNSRLVIMGDFRQINNKQLRETDYNADDGCGLAYAVAFLAESR